MSTLVWFCHGKMDKDTYVFMMTIFMIKIIAIDYDLYQRSMK